MNIHQLTLALTFKHILGNELRYEMRYAQFFTHLSMQRLLGRLAIVDMASNGSIPFPWLDIFPVGTSLQIDVATGVEHMKVHNRMKQLSAAMTLTTSGRAYDGSCLVDYREYFLLIIHFELL